MESQHARLVVVRSSLAESTDAASDHARSCLGPEATTTLTAAETHARYESHSAET
jgi:hypothetical protein